MIVQLLDKLIPRGTVQGQKGRVLNQIERIEAKKARDRMAVKKQGTDHGPEVKKEKLEISLVRLLVSAADEHMPELNTSMKTLMKKLLKKLMKVKKVYVTD